MRAASLSLALLASPCLAESWQLHPGLGVRAADVYLSSRNPSDQYGSSSQTVRGSLQLKREDKTSLWDSDLKVESARANDAPYGETKLRSRYLVKDHLSLSSLDLGYQTTHGYDPLMQPIEEAALGDSRRFEAATVGLYHQITLDPQHDLSLHLSTGKTDEESQGLRSRDAQIAWDYHNSLMWTSRIRARITDAGSKQRELTHTQLLRFSQKLSSELSYGYGWQSHPGDLEGAWLWGAALQYQSAGTIPQSTAYQALTPVKEVSSSQDQALRGVSLYRLGWGRSRDQRRAGDPYFYADLFYGSSRIELEGNQSLEFKGSRTQGKGVLSLVGRSRYVSELLQGSYAWQHRFFTRYPDATLEASYSAERTAFSPERYFREIYQVSYQLLW